MACPRPLKVQVGVVGRTGAGKSSLVMALLRVLKATAGSIYIDGVDIASVPLRNLRSVITVIPQDPSLMRGTLREVLDPTSTCSEEEVRKALQEVHLSEFVAQHPKNIFMELGDAGGNLSAGQKQLVCLARALLRKPRILILDEATSHMDDDTDRLIQRTLRRGFRGCTMLTIAHRLNTVLDHDRILVMDGGHVAEFGATLELASNPSSRFHVMLSRAGLTPEDVRFYSELSNGVSTHL